MWGKIIIPMYRLWLHSLYGLYGPRCPLSQKRPINLISLSLCIITDFVAVMLIGGINSLWPGDTLWHHRAASTFIQVMTCRLYDTTVSILVQVTDCHLFGTKPIPCRLIVNWTLKTKFSEIWMKSQNSFDKMHLKIHNSGHLIQASVC